MRLKVIRADETIKHVALSGRLDFGGVNDVQYDFLQETTILPTATVVDLSKVTYIASIGIGMLLSAAKHLERHGAKMVLLAPSGLVGEALATSAIHSVVPIADDEAAALDLLR